VLAETFADQCCAVAGLGLDHQRAHVADGTDCQAKRLTSGRTSAASARPVTAPPTTSEA
jgi:hypothetical protein